MTGMTKDYRWFDYNYYICDVIRTCIRDIASYCTFFNHSTNSCPIQLGISFYATIPTKKCDRITNVFVHYESAF